MHGRQYARAAATFGLTAFVASLLIISGPTAAGADTSPTHETACVDTDGFVNVDLNDATSSDTNQTTYQVSLSGPSRDANQYPDGGGPSLISVGGNPVKVRLAGPVYDDDHVSITGDGPLTTSSLSIGSDCTARNSTDVTVNPPVLAAGPAATCDTSAEIGVAATLQNKTALTSSYMDQTGLDSVDYTVLVVNSDTGSIADDASLIQFAPSASQGTVYNATDAACFAVPANKSASYEVRAISVNGAVKTVSALTVTAPTSTSSATVSVTPSATPTPTTTTTTSPTPVRSSPNPSASATASSQANHSASQTTSDGQIVVNGPTNVGPITTSPSASASASSNHATPSAGRSSSAPTPTPSTSAGGTISVKRLAEPPLEDGSHIFVWQSGPAMIVLLDALAISALIGGVLWSAKRR
jgi:hypothetical protein